MSDNELEFLSQQFKDLCLREGVKRHFTMKGTPKKNGIAERMKHY